jgi:outer membrane protein
MQSTYGIKIIVICLVLGLIAFIFFSGKNNPSSLTSGTQIQPSVSEFNPALFIEESKYKLSASDREILNGLENADAGDLQKFLSISSFWNDVGNLPATAYYLEMVAELNPTEENWQKAALKYFEAQKIYAQDSLTFYEMLNSSMSAYRKVLEINPENIDAKADLAVCYVEGTKDVMKGVGMLREILELNPEHQKSLFYLGVLSMQSGQYEKARERFEQLVVLQPGNPFHYYYLGQIHMAMGNKTKAVAFFENYKHLVQDVNLRKEADHLINSIKN